MQIVTLVNQAAGSAITGSAVAYRPVAGYTSVFVAEVKRTSGSGAPSNTTRTIALQGSLDGTDWFTVDSVVVSSMTNSWATSDYTVSGGYRTYVKVVQGFPLMRVVLSEGVDANVSLIAYIANG